MSVIIKKKPDDLIRSSDWVVDTWSPVKESIFGFDPSQRSSPNMTAVARAIDRWATKSEDAKAIQRSFRMISEDTAGPIGRDDHLIGGVAYDRAHLGGLGGRRIYGIHMGIGFEEAPDIIADIDANLAYVHLEKKAAFLGSGMLADRLSNEMEPEELILASSARQERKGIRQIGPAFQSERESGKILEELGYSYDPEIDRHLKNRFHEFVGDRMLSRWHCERERLLIARDTYRRVVQKTRDAGIAIPEGGLLTGQANHAPPVGSNITLVRANFSILPKP